ncbi:30989_t:CDS:2 [Gigaspora margarita]|uniref:30989_t:CDS:1 n=1 Tax=Gigaspora margarita TaxID=4874 RepID=A0ABN7UG04_GIGMA|nr:30989_t:CDS:2 [Gigaspora margarita]
MLLDRFESLLSESLNIFAILESLGFLAAPLIKSESCFSNKSLCNDFIYLIAASRIKKKEKTIKLNCNVQFIKLVPLDITTMPFVALFTTTSN